MKRKQVLVHDYRPVVGGRIDIAVLRFQENGDLDQRHSLLQWLKDEVYSLETRRLLHQKIR